MVFFLSVLYFVTYYLTPPVLFGQLVVFRVELILAILIFLLSVHKVTGSIIVKTPQSVALIGLAFAASLSVLISTGWATQAASTFLGFLPNGGLAYFLVCLHCNSKKKLQVLVLMLLFVCLFVIAHGYIDLLHGVPVNGPPQGDDIDSSDRYLWNVQHPYLLGGETPQERRFID